MSSTAATTRGEVSEMAQSARWHRYEAKYLVDEATAARIRSLCRSRMPLDPYSVAHSDRKYPVRSVYLDSGDFQTLRATIERLVDRVKLRVRTYRHWSESTEGETGFFEIKRKSHGIICKTRAKLDPAFVSEFLWNGNAAVDRLSDADSETIANLEQFMAMRTRLVARPVLSVFYMREAYQSDGIDRARVTFDTDLHYGLLSSGDARGMEMWWPVRLESTIVEIKFTNTFPFWIANLIRRGELMRRGVCKYLFCSEYAGHTVDTVGLAT